MRSRLLLSPCWRSVTLQAACPMRLQWGLLARHRIGWCYLQSSAVEQGGRKMKNRTLSRLLIATLVLALLTADVPLLPAGRVPEVHAAGPLECPLWPLPRRRRAEKAQPRLRRGRRHRPRDQRLLRQTARRDADHAPGDGRPEPLPAR